MSDTETPVALSGGTTISWAHFTFNPWWGCSHVSPACDHCYAETLAARFAPGMWEKDGPRRFFAPGHWRDPVRWDKRAAKNGTRYRVFCASMADVFELRPDLDGQRAHLWHLIEATPNLDWMLLTKRPQHVGTMVPSSWLDRGNWPRRVWIGTTVEDQAHARVRIPRLLEIPARVRFLSCEPLLGPLDLDDWLRPLSSSACADPECCYPYDSSPIHWVIAGGESGRGARPMAPGWVREIRDDCDNAGVPFHFKQWGEWGQDDQGTRARVGKKAAGRTLDGHTHDAFPEGG